MSEFSFEYDYIQNNSKWQGFEYSQRKSTEYMFLYSRHFLSDLTEFNAPIFIDKERVGAFLNAENSFDKLNEYDSFKDQELQIDKIYNNTKGMIEKIIRLMRTHSQAEIQHSEYLIQRSIVYVGKWKEPTHVYYNSNVATDLCSYLTVQRPVHDLNVYKDIFTRNLNNIKSTKLYSPYLLHRKNILSTTLNKQTILSDPINILNEYIGVGVFRNHSLASNYLNTNGNVKPIEDKKRTNIYQDYILKQPHKKEAFYSSEKIRLTFIEEKRLITNRSIIIKREVAGLTKQKESGFLYRDIFGLIINNGDSLLKRARIGFSVNDNNFIIDRERREIPKIINTLLPIKRERLGFIIFDTNANAYNDSKRRPFVVQDFDEFVMTNLIGINSIEKIKDNMPDNSTGIIFAQKINSDKAFLFDYNQLLEKLQHDAEYIKINNTLQKIIDNTGIGPKLGLWGMKDSHKSFIQYHNVLLKKKHYNAILENNSNFINNMPTKAYEVTYDKFIVKNKKPVVYDNYTVFVGILNKRTMLSDQIWISNSPVGTFTEEKIKWADKNLKDIRLSSNFMFIDKNVKQTQSINVEKWFSSNIKSVGFGTGDKQFDIRYSLLDYEDAKFANADQKRVISQSQTGVFGESVSITKPLGIHDDTVNVDREKEDGSYYPGLIFVDKSAFTSSLIQTELSVMKNTLRRLDTPNPKTFNWAWVYQYEDPIKPNKNYYGIDELLLPENDIKYEEFIDVIFDKTKMMPKNPVKIIDDTTFVAKYPTKHPIPNYEKLGIEYIDVPSELMRDLFLKFYQIWYNNVFKFGNMAMVDSVNLMMDYMYSYIVINYSGTEQFEAALRILRLIRWFAETSVMRNSQYIISYVYEDLKSQLQTGVCQIENSMYKMKVNKDMAVICTDTMSIGNSEAYVTLFINNKKDTEITFSISFFGGSVDVYLNGELIDVITGNKVMAKYDIPFEVGIKNELTIKRSVTQNIGLCYIGNIIVKDGKFKDLSVQYDPDLKMGNLPLNDIVQKMILLANMYEDEKEQFEKFKTGNWAVSELYQRLQTYWELHHQDKIKGKRLTIKET
jgi:hypothetical protein